MNGDRLREARQRAGLTQTDLGERVGVSQSMIGALEHGRRSASRELEQALAEELGVAADSLTDSASTIPDTPESLLKNPRTAEGLCALARDRVLAASLDIQPEEWRALRSLMLPAPATKDGYVALLMTIRLVTGGRGTPTAGAGQGAATASETSDSSGTVHPS
ncbi:MAG: helix-turn-helix transcriptional regulator [Lamprobacter sp.]|uniref:helix-turn-helix domain-containing protein n=1 Tax=Lamprobacter sp. TaxID=3100796 RepID=UPI002B259779|nr:helix-turn-helix transcriptional regulator [Lamprobacter sp.]MEA3640240.1 helix-turn-helix transcriptional regulator [Lamprobacter sp.]